MNLAVFPLCNFKDSAVRRYSYRVLTAMAVYVVAVVAVTWTFVHHHPHGPLAYVLAALPAIPVVAVIAAFGIFLSELKDEFVRTVMVHSSLWATGVILGFATFWGFLENYTHPPTLPMFWLFVMWWVAFAGAQPLVWRRFR